MPLTGNDGVFVSAVIVVIEVEPRLSPPRDVLAVWGRDLHALRVGGGPKESPSSVSCCVRARTLMSAPAFTRMHVTVRACECHGTGAYSCVCVCVCACTCVLCTLTFVVVWGWGIRVFESVRVAVLCVCARV